MDTVLLVFAIIILIVIVYLIIINQRNLKKVVTHKRDEDVLKISDERYYELDNKIQLIIVVASIIILVGGFIGYNSIDTIQDDIQETLGDYDNKLNDYDTTVIKYQKLLSAYETKMKTTADSLSETKNESERMLTSLKKLQEDYRLNAKTYFVKGIKISQELLKDNSQVGQIYFKELKPNNPKIPSVFIEEPFISIVGIGEGIIAINKITNEYFEYSFNGFRDADDGFLAILEAVNINTLNEEEKDLLVKLKSIIRNATKQNKVKSKATAANSFDLIIIEGIKNP